jgi:hypothetical protein
MKYSLASVLNRVIPNTHGEFCWNQRVCGWLQYRVYMFYVMQRGAFPRFSRALMWISIFHSSILAQAFFIYQHFAL